MPATIGKCLARIRRAAAALAGCDDLDAEWSAVKRAYFKTALKTHPDKGGDAPAFRKVQAAFEALRGAYDRGCADPTAGFLFSASAAQPAAQAAASPSSPGPEVNIPWWEYYAEAAAEAVPTYRVERARSARSRCQAKGAAQCCADDLIPKDELRVGWLNAESGTYGGWVHLRCWRSG